MSTEEEKTGLTLIILKYISLNLGAYVLVNYDKILGALFSFASFIYVCIKIWKELKKSKDETYRDSDKSA